MLRVKRSGEEDDEESPCTTKELSDPTVAVKMFDTRILTIPLITDLVFADFLHSDLLKFSLVSKSWNLACRRILVDRFRTYLTLSEKSTVQSLEDFYNLIRDVVPDHQHPFNGIRIKFNTKVQVYPFSSEPFVDLISRIMEQLQIKCVSLDLSNVQLQAADFNDILKALVITHLGTVEFLEILGFQGNPEMLSKRFKVNSLLNLKELDFGNSLNRMKNSHLKRILLACPNLKTCSPVLPHQLSTLRYIKINQQLASQVRFDFMRLTPEDLKLLQDYSSVIKHLEVHQHKVLYRNQHEGEFISRLRFLFTTRLQFNLESLDIQLEPLVALLQNPMPALPNVKELCVRGGQRWFPCLFMNEEVRFAQFLPNLKSVTFSWTAKYSIWLDQKYQAEDNLDEDGPVSLFECTVPASLDSVTNLKLYCSGKTWTYPYDTLTKLMDLDEVFPRVTYLDIHMDISGLEDFLKWICESWGDSLETLILRGTECLGFYSYPLIKLKYDWEGLQELKRKDFPLTVCSEKFSHLRHLELEFQHPIERDCTGNYVTETVKVQNTFEPRIGHEVQLIISGCRAENRMKNVKNGVSIYDTILALHFCPRNLELSPMEEIVADQSICRTICKMLPTADLRSCRHVNRSWNAVAREVFHERGSFTITLDPSILNRKIDELRNLSKLWRFLEGKHFNRLRVKCGSYCRRSNSFKWFAKAFAHFLEEFDFSQTCFKELELQLYDDSDDFDDEFFQRRDLNIKVCKTLFQKLDLHRVQELVTSIEHFDECFRDEEGNLLFPNLQSIKFQEPEELLEYPHPKVFRKLLEDLKYLERIEVPVSNKFLPLLSSAGKAHCVKQVKLFKSPQTVSLSVEDGLLVRKASLRLGTEGPPTDVLRILMNFVAKHEPRIEHFSVGNDVRLCDSDFQELDPMFRRLFRGLCTSSFESLHTLDVTLPLLPKIVGAITRPLVALKKILLLFDEKEFDPRGLLAQIHFSDMAPNLEEVNLTRVIHSSPDFVLCSTFRWSTREGMELVPIRHLSSVKSLEYRITLLGSFTPDWAIPWSSELWTVEYLARLFPNITKFSFLSFDSTRGTGNGFAAVLSLILKSWPGLEILEVTVDSMDAISLETSILGISEEEWSVWKELLGSKQKIDALNNMHYAPSSLSIRSCKNLKGFRNGSCIESQLVKWSPEWYGIWYWRKLCLTRRLS